MKRVAIIILSILGLLILTAAIWYYFRKARLVQKSDPYAALRASAGPFSEEAWSGSDMSVNGKGYWIIVGQDYEPVGNEQSKIHSSVKAFLKGYDIMPTTAVFRSSLIEDFDAFIQQHGYMNPMNVIQGEFLP